MSLPPGMAAAWGAVAVTLATVLTHPGTPEAWAQRGDAHARDDGPEDYIPERKFTSGDTVADLCLVPAVADELKLDSSQRRKLLEAYQRAMEIYRIRSLTADVRGAFTAWEDAYRDGDPVNLLDAVGQLASSRALLTRALAERDEDMMASLTAQQRARIAQILIRRLGIRAIARKDVARELKLLPPQGREVRAILDRRDVELWSLKEQRRGLARATGYAQERQRILNKVSDKQALTEEELSFLQPHQPDGILPAQADIDRYEAQVDAQLWRVLTPAQRRRFGAMQGEPFDVRLLTRDAQPPEAGEGDPVPMP